MKIPIKDMIFRDVFLLQAIERHKSFVSPISDEDGFLKRRTPSEFRKNLNLASIYSEEAITLEGFDIRAGSCLVKPIEDVFIK